MTDFRVLQQQWTAWIRQPDAQPMPEGEERRLHIYRELFFNNVSSFVESAFPVLKKHLSESDWQTLLTDFFALHACQSPYFYDISHEFLRFLPTQTRLLALYPWLIELAHFEWAELAAEMAEAEWPFAVQGDFWQDIPVLSPLLWPLVYQWPVHVFAQQNSPPPASVCCLLMYRSRDEQVNVMEVNPLTLHLIQSLQRQPQLTGQQIVEGLAEQFNLAPESLVVASDSLFHTFAQSDIVLGVQTDVCV